MKVLKFGGTSVGSADNIKRVKEIVDEVDDQVVVVVSAMGGITDRLIKAANLAAKGDSTYISPVEEIVELHKNVVTDLFPAKKQQTEVLDHLASEFDELKSINKGVFLIRELSHKSLESISGIGERLSSKIIASYIKAQWFDSRGYIKSYYEYGKSQADLESTNKVLKEAKHQLGKLSLFPGFVSSNKKGDNTTLGRGGSDYTASLLAAAFDADMLEIWTDVDGFMTADPKVISRAYCIDHLSYAEAMELSHFGAKVIYPPTILPVYQKNIPITIKNTFNPKASGTLIDGVREVPKPRQIKGISSIKNVSLLTVQGIGMVGVSGISMRLFSSLAAKEINVILISQASSENSISVVIESSDTSRACKAIEKEFSRELADRQISHIVVDDQMSVVAIVGENMKHSTGIAGLLFNSVGKNGVNVYAIAQGASELNISFVIKEHDIKKALNVIHESFFLSDYSRLNLFLVGKGTVGSKLLNKISVQTEKLMKDNRLKVRLVGLAGSKAMVFDSEGLDAALAIERLEKEGEAGKVTDFRDRIIDMNLANSVFVDCSASEDVANI
jgi:aspartokinase/homoserine dehydrogenase 1